MDDKDNQLDAVDGMHRTISFREYLAKALDQQTNHQAQQLKEELMQALAEADRKAIRKHSLLPIMILEESPQWSVPGLASALNFDAEHFVKMTQVHHFELMYKVEARAMVAFTI